MRLLSGSLGLAMIERALFGFRCIRRNLCIRLLLIGYLMRADCSIETHADVFWMPPILEGRQSNGSRGDPSRARCGLRVSLVEHQCEGSTP